MYGIESADAFATHLGEPDHSLPIHCDPVGRERLRVLFVRERILLRDPGVDIDPPQSACVDLGEPDAARIQRQVIRSHRQRERLARIAGVGNGNRGQVVELVLARRGEVVSDVVGILFCKPDRIVCCDLGVHDAVLSTRRCPLLERARPGIKDGEEVAVHFSEPQASLMVAGESHQAIVWLREWILVKGTGCRSGGGSGGLSLCWCKRRSSRLSSPCLEIPPERVTMTMEPIRRDSSKNQASRRRWDDQRADHRVAPGTTCRACLETSSLLPSANRGTCCRLFMLPSLCAGSIMQIDTIQGYTFATMGAALRRAENALQIALQGVLGQLTGHFGDDHPLTIEKEGLRHTCETIVDSCGAGIVYNAGIGDPVGVQEIQPLSMVILEIDAEKDDSLALDVLPRCLQKGSFMLTGDAPRGPEVEHHRLPFQACQVYRWRRARTEGSQRKIWCGVSEKGAAPGIRLALCRCQQLSPQQDEQRNAYKAH